MARKQTQTAPVATPAVVAPVSQWAGERARIAARVEAGVTSDEAKTGRGGRFAALAAVLADAKPGARMSFAAFERATAKYTSNGKGLARDSFASMRTLLQRARQTDVAPLLPARVRLEGTEGSRDTMYIVVAE